MDFNASVDGMKYWLTRERMCSPLSGGGGSGFARLICRLTCYESYRYHLVSPVSSVYKTEPVKNVV